MLSMSDTNYSQYAFQENITRIVNIQEEMEVYIKDSISDYIENRFFYSHNACDYLEPEIREKYDKMRVAHYLMQPIHDVIAEVFRYNYHDNIQLSFVEDDVEEFFSRIYKNTDFLNNIDPRYHIICKRWYDFVLHELDQSFIVRVLGYALYYFVADDDMDHLHNRSVNLSYQVAGMYKKKHPEIRWNHYYDEDSLTSRGI